MAEGQGTFCEKDEFTDADRELLRDLQIREVARVEESAHKFDDGGEIVKGWERRECYTFTAPEIGTLRFDIRGIKDAIVDGRINVQAFKMTPIDPAFYEHVLKNNGVEEPRIAQIGGRDLDRPGIMVMWPDGHSSLIDGNHRMCKRYRLGLESFRFLMVNVLDCVPHMCRPGDEARLFERRYEHDPRYVETLHSEVRMED